MPRQKTETKTKIEVTAIVNVAEKTSLVVVMLGALILGITFAGAAVNQLKSEFTAAAETTLNISACGNLDQANTTYVLTQDVSSEKTCFGILNNGITLDLNGHTVTYGNFATPEVANGDFESGSGAAPDSWDLSNAPEAERFAGSYIQPVELYSGSYGMKFDLPASPQYVLSDSNVSLSANTTYALTAMVKNQVGSDITIYVEIEGTSYRAEYTQYTWRPFQLISYVFRPTSGVNAKIKFGISGSGLSESGTIYLDDIKLQTAYYHGVAIPVNWSSYYTPDVSLASVSSPDDITIKNGAIVQGSDNTYFGHNFMMPEGVNNIEIDNVDGTVQGIMSSNVYAPWNQNYEIHDSILTSNSITIASRDQNNGAQISLSRSPGGNKIYNNQIIGGPQDGIYIDDFDSGSAGGTEIYSNTIKLKTRYTNGFAIEDGGNNVVIHDNIVLNVDGYWGRGFHVGDGAEVYDNYLEIEDLPNNQEYNGCTITSFAMQIEESVNVHIHNNTIIARTESGYCEAATLRFTDPNAGNLIEDNALTAAAAVGAEARVFVFSFMGDMSGVIFRNNSITSNSSWMDLGYWPPTSPHNIYGENNTFNIGNNPADFIGLRGVSSTGHIFVNNYYGGASAKSAFESDSIRYYAAADDNSDFTVKWLYDPTVKNISNSPIQNATVTVKNGVATIFSGTTGSDGTLASPPALSDFKNAGGIITDYGTYTITITAAGYQDYSAEIDPTEPLLPVLVLDSVSAPEETCFENWSCTDWSVCSGGLRNRTCTEVNSCGTTDEKPSESESCQVSQACAEDWLCSSWSACTANEQSRSCVDRNNCGTEADKPAETFDCTLAEAPAGDTINPNTQIISGPGEIINSHKTNFTWLGTDDVTDAADLLFAYKFDDEDWSDWLNSSSVNLFRIRNGQHVFYVRAKDAAGNIDQTPAQINFIVLKEQYLVAVPNQSGGPMVRVFDRQGRVVSQFFAFDQDFRGGLTVAMGDLGGDETDEIIVAPGGGYAPEVRIFRQDGTFINSFYAYAETFQQGVNVTTGDFDGDGIDEIATAPMSGGGPNIRIFGYRNGSFVPVTANFMAYDPLFKGGVSLTAADFEGDGIDEIITMPFSGGGPHIRIFGVRDREFKPVTLGLMAFASHLRGGYNIATGNFNADNSEEMITSLISGGGPHIRMFGRARYGVVDIIHPGFMAFMPDFRGGVSLAALDVDLNGFDEIAAGVGSAGDPLVRIFGAAGDVIVKEFYAFDNSFKGGIRIASGE